jgi:hypothetical protein
MKTMTLILAVVLGGCGASGIPGGNDVAMRGSLTETVQGNTCGLSTRTFPVVIFSDGHMVGAAQEVDLLTVGPGGTMSAFRPDAADFYGSALAPGAAGNDYGIMLQVSGQAVSGTSWEEVRSAGTSCEASFQVSGSLL